MKEIIILTKSSKHGNHCVAGINTADGRWVRLVSDNAETHGALSDDDLRYADGTYCKPLDVAYVAIERPAPLPYQPENYLIRKGFMMSKDRECSLREVFYYHRPEKRKFLFGNLDYRVSDDEIEKVGHSLTLIEVQHLIFRHKIREDGTVKIKASFMYGNNWYNNISVTDPDYYGIENETKFPHAYLVVSLPDVPYADKGFYKFVAKVFLP